MLRLSVQVLRFLLATARLHAATTAPADGTDVLMTSCSMMSSSSTAACGGGSPQPAAYNDASFSGEGGEVFQGLEPRAHAELRTLIGLGVRKLATLRYVWLAHHLIAQLHYWLPALVMAPRLLHGEVSLGELTQAQKASSSINHTLIYAVKNVDSFAGFATATFRLHTLVEEMSVHEVGTTAHGIRSEVPPCQDSKQLELQRAGEDALPPLEV